jgi:hypothetical protein
MDEFFTVNFQRLRELKRDVSFQRQYFEEARDALESAKDRFKHLESFLNAEIELSQDPELRAALDEILNEPNYRIMTRLVTAKDYPEEVRGLNKTQLLIRLLSDENNGRRGVSPKGLHILAQHFDEGKDITLPYVNNILSRFHKLGRVEQIEDKYWLTEAGRDWRKGIIRGKKPT